LEFVLTNASKNNPKATEDAINQFCRINWMMNVGDEKGAILKLAVQQRNPKTILELGGYCGFSALIMASTSNANVHSLEPN
jgi:catechol O-methyltransferase